MNAALLETLLSARQVEDIWPPFLSQMQSFGFDRVLYGFTRQRSGTHLGNRDDFVVLSNLGSDYLTPYLEGGLYFDGPMLRWSKENVGPCSWSWLQDNIDQLTKAERRVLDFNRSHGVTNGYTISFDDISARQKGGVALIAPADIPQAEIDRDWDRQGREICIICNVFHLKITTLPFAPPGRELTERQRQVLEWVGDGKTMQDIAAILGLTQATIEKHLRRAREALDVETTAQAVLRAASQNQIYVLQP
ncbi:LuxR family transcriptional regulator [Actibacterium ureilyticum]|uniref:LuxR family transcriptional regulator n=1 Tax=Actibacterium ureilyticum TaxID=1590614 RepID=UPI000BAAAD7B|nr:LuxR family transcriptional regulator [Actibacterium ureilyticum]